MCIRIQLRRSTSTTHNTITIETIKHTTRTNSNSNVCTSNPHL